MYGSFLRTSPFDNNLLTISFVFVIFAQQKKKLSEPGSGRMTWVDKRAANWLPSERFPSSASCVYTTQKNGNLNAAQKEEMRSSHNNLYTQQKTC